MHLQPGMRVLDLGCGTALSSIFLAKEFGVQVWATDLWVKATDNYGRIAEAGVADKVFPIHADARTLPYANGFFDAVVSMDAYHYFGTDDMYLGHHLARLVRSGGEIGVIVPGLANEFAEVPGHLRPYWHWEFSTFHSPLWWRRHWSNAGAVKVVKADRISEGWRDWITWSEVCAEAGHRADNALREAEMLRVDAGRNLGFTRLVALAG
jgi:cyclopropane fatty-acyl-phospholipid synthase-like methyltransferase